MSTEQDHALHPCGVSFDVPYANADTYHADYDSGDSHSSLELFRESPGKYAAIRVFRTMQAEPPSASMKFGLALHNLMLEYTDTPKFAMRKSKKPSGKRELHVGPSCYIESAKLLTKKDMALLWNHLLALSAEADAWNLLVEQNGCNERIFSSVDQQSGLQLKCKPDRVLENGLVVDLKTVDGPVDPLSWSRCLSKWGYHRQAAFYLDVLAGAGQKADTFVFVAVSKDPPHEIGIYPIDAESLELGREENRDDLDRLVECRRTGVWKHEWQGKILTVGVPRWRLQK